MREKLTVIVGSMFSGKTQELIRLVERSEFAGKKAQIFKPHIDNRWGKPKSVCSHAGAEKRAIPINVQKPQEILKKLKSITKLVAIDEAQFFHEDVVEIVEKLLCKSIEVLVAGLPTDFRGEPFGPMPTLLAKADSIVRLTAVCTFQDKNGICGREATRTQRLIDGRPADYHDPVVLIGAAESYAARCPAHHEIPGKPKTIV